MNLKFRLSLMNFLEFAVWGAYLTCMGNYLGVAGLGVVPLGSRRLYAGLLVVRHAGRLW